MNLGTKIRTIILLIASINVLIFTCLHLSWWSGITAISILIAAWIGWYYNEDLTVEDCIGTGVTRQMKLEKDDNYVGDFFFNLNKEIEIDEEEANE